MTGRQDGRPTAVALVLSLVLGGSFAATACQDGSTGDPTSAAGAAAQPIELTEVASIGCATCSAEEQLSVWTMGVDGDGLIWAVDRYAPHMRVFRRDGGLVAAFGPTGQGPGDFMTGPMDSMVTGTAVLPGTGGRTLVHQLFPPALVELDLDGVETARKEIDWPDPFGRIAMVMVRAPAAAAAYALTYEQAASRDGEPFDIRRLDLDADPVIVERIASGRDLFPDWEPDERYLRVWFPMALAPDGTLAVGNSLTYEIVRLTPNGEVTARFRHDAERPAFHPETLEALRRSASRDGWEDQLEEGDLHFHRSSFEFDDRGRLWVLVNRPDRERSIFDVFAPDGAHLQQVEIPDHVQRFNLRGVDPAFVLSDGFLAATVVGPDEEDRIKVWRVVDGF